VKPAQAWKGDIKADLEGKIEEGVERILLFHDRDKPQVVLNKVINLQFPYIAPSLWTGIVPISFSGTMLHSLGHLKSNHIFQYHSEQTLFKLICFTDSQFVHIGLHFL
jgi:hypothetical protein